MLALLLAASVCGCKRLPNPDADEVARALMHLDRAHRPAGEDLPIERYFAWVAEKDAGKLAAADHTARLARLCDDQKALVERLEALRTRSDDALLVLEAYLGAHVKAHHGMEEVLLARKGGDPARAAQAEAEVRAAMEDLQAARRKRAEVEARYEVRPAEAGSLSK